MTSTLIVHSGASYVTRQELRGIATPPSTATHAPIAHADLVTLIEGGLDHAGYHIVREQYAVMSKGLTLFGLLDLTNGSAPREGTGYAVGFRHANNRHMALSIVGGFRVFICDNMALSGDRKVFSHPHRPGVINALTTSLARFFGDALKEQFAVIEDRFRRWEREDLFDDDARVLIYRALETGVIPGRLRADVHTNYFDADALHYADCAPRTKLGLQNAFTRAFKTLNPAPAYGANLSLTRLLG
jgi:hypothetical protein